jgi:uncharacterized membrane protein (DUF106 family)
MKLIKKIKAAQAQNDKKLVEKLAKIAEEMLLPKSVFSKEDQELMDLISGL